MPLPTLTTGSGMTAPGDGRDDPGLRPPRTFPIWAIAGTVGVFLIINVSIFGWYVNRLRKRRRAYNFAALDHATQFNLSDMSDIELNSIRGDVGLLPLPGDAPRNLNHPTSARTATTSLHTATAKSTDEKRDINV